MTTDLCYASTLTTQLMCDEYFFFRTIRGELLRLFRAAGMMTTSLHLPSIFGQSRIE